MPSHKATEKKKRRKEKAKRKQETPQEKMNIKREEETKNNFILWQYTQYEKHKMLGLINIQ
tara:strand:- start:1261 stop:1443 length:183 start_codon:yes stop_codon:yes gene_type:complete